MRSIIIGESKIQVRGLTPNEIKQLKSKGIPISRISIDIIKLAGDLDLAEKTMDEAFKLILKPEECKILNDLSNSETIKIWKGILDETFGSPSEEKNS